MQRAEKAGVDLSHFDMMDGHYVPNLALTPHHLKALRPYSLLPFHTHLELNNPDDILSSFTSLQADMIIVQWNTLTYLFQTFDRIRSQNIKIGLGLNPDDAFDEASRFIQDLDLFLLLGLYPGFGGQPMQPGNTGKGSHPHGFWQIKSDHQIKIAVDGGVKPENAASLVEAGADILIMGTALFQSSDMVATVKIDQGVDIARSPRR